MTQWQKGCNQVMGPTTHQCILGHHSILSEGQCHSWRQK